MKYNRLKLNISDENNEILKIDIIVDEDNKISDAYIGSECVSREDLLSTIEKNIELITNYKNK